MENSFDFKSTIATSREQSEKLLSLGLKKETSDMTIHIKKDGSWYVTAEPFYEWEDDLNTLPCLEEPEKIIPAWSLYRLMEIAFPKGVGIVAINGMFNNIINLVEKRINNGTFLKEYLND